MGKNVRVMKRLPKKYGGSRNAQRSDTNEKLFSDEADVFYRNKTALPKDINYIPVDGNLSEDASSNEDNEAMQLNFNDLEDEEIEDGSVIDSNDEVAEGEHESVGNGFDITNRTQWGTHAKDYYESDIDDEASTDEETMALRIKEAEHINAYEDVEGLKDEDFSLQLLTKLAKREKEGTAMEAINDATDKSKRISNTHSSLNTLKKGATFEQELQAVISAMEMPINTLSVQGGISGLKIEGVSEVEIKAAIDEACPEFEPLLTDLKEKFEEIRVQLESIIRKEESKEFITEEGMSFLHTKNMLLLGYLTYLSYYLLLKINGKPVENHPVIRRLVEYRIILEKLRPIEQKLKYQIDKLLFMAENFNAEEDTVYKPNPEMLVNIEDEQTIDSLENTASASDNVYRPPKLMPVEYTSMHITTAEKANREMMRQKERLRRSEMVQLMREELADEPEEMEAQGAANLPTDLDTVRSMKDKRTAALLHKHLEREQFEEENLTRLPVTKKYRNEMKELALRRKQLVRGDGLSELSAFAESVMDTRDSEATVGKRTPLSAYLNSATQSKEIQSKIAEAKKHGDRLVQSRRYLPASKPGSNATVDNSLKQLGKDVSDDSDFEEFKEQKAEKQKKKRKLLLEKAALHIPEKDAVLKPGLKRGTTRQIDQNKGIVRIRKPIEGNARAHYRLKHAKKMKKLKSSQMKMRPFEANYTGERSGIKAHSKRSTALS